METINLTKKPNYRDLDKCFENVIQNYNYTYLFNCLEGIAHRISF